MLAALKPRSEVMAVHADSYTGFLLHPTSTIGDAPPMASVRLRGGRPAMVAVLDRGFRQTGPGRHQAGAILPAEGGFELVLSTGIGGMTLCHPVPTAAPEAGAAQDPGRMSARVGPAGPDGSRPVTLGFTDATGAALPPPPGLLSLAALEGGWTRRIAIGPQADAALDLPPLGPFVATLVAADGREYPPLLFEVTP